MRKPSLQRISYVVFAAGAIAVLLVIPAWASDDGSGDPGGSQMASVSSAGCATADGDAIALEAVPAQEVGNANADADAETAVSVKGGVISVEAAKGELETAPAPESKGADEVSGVATIEPDQESKAIPLDEGETGKVDVLEPTEAAQAIEIPAGKTDPASGAGESGGVVCSTEAAPTLDPEQAPGDDPGNG